MSEFYEPFIPEDERVDEAALEPEYEPGRDGLGRVKRVAKIGGNTIERILITPHWMQTNEAGARVLSAELAKLDPPLKLGEVFDTFSAGGGLFTFRRIGMPNPEPESQLMTVGLDAALAGPIAQNSRQSREQVRKEVRSMLGKLAGMTKSAKKSAASSANLKKARDARWAKKREGEIAAVPALAPAPSTEPVIG